MILDLGTGYSTADKKGRVPAHMDLTSKQKRKVINDI